MSGAVGKIGVVAGSGIQLEPLLDEIVARRPFGEFPGLEAGRVEGHGHYFVEGRCGGVDVIVQCGRLHMYEGFDYLAATRTVDVLHEMGVTTVIFTNAAGGLVLGMRPGDLVAVDRVRMWRYHPWAATPGMLFPDFTVAGCTFTGTYQWMPGPAYETRAEIAALQSQRISAVGMSAAPELMRCQELGMKAAVIACITNCCCRREKVSHDQVVTAAAKASPGIVALIREALRAGQ